MQTKILDLVDKHQMDFDGLDNRLSLEKFMDYLILLGKNKKANKYGVFGHLLNKIKDTETNYGQINEQNIEHYSEVLYFIYNLLVPFLLKEESTMWGLASPVCGRVFYGTDAFYGLVENKTDHDIKTLNDIDGFRLQILYQLILDQLYGIPSYKESETSAFSVLDNETGLTKYIGISIDNSYVKVMPKGPLPKLDLDAIIENNAFEVDWKIFLSILPLENFKFEGFSIIRLTDTTLLHVTERLNNIAIERVNLGFQVFNEELENHLKTLTENPKLKANLIPALKLNGTPVLDYLLEQENSVFGRLLREFGSDKELKPALIGYFNNPKTIVYNMPAVFSNSKSPFIEKIAELGVGSFSCVPLTHQGNIVGVLELFTENSILVRASDISKLKSITTILSRLAHDWKIDFENQLEIIIKDKFTPIQPSVEWKFYEVAWSILRNGKVSDNKLEDLRFKNVHPFYGSIDIRDSTVWRNNANVEDHKILLDVLTQTIDDLLEIQPLDLGLMDLKKITLSWKSLISTDNIDSVQAEIEEFLLKDVNPLFEKLQMQKGELSGIIGYYKKEMLPYGNCYTHRNDFENAVRIVNNTILSELEVLNRDTQEYYPCYFEKFRSDGVEYDIYIGQTITPKRKLRKEYIEQIQYLQLKSMATIVRSLESIKKELPIAIQTTQLLFLGNTNIDISYRMDERRFDVEGTYNTRYHIIKKRIDKVLVKNTSQRLTQPGKIVLVYIHETTRVIYMNYISKLQKEGVLNDEVEVLELQKLQGVSGLKALRVGVVLP
ncbi:hypothetical protein ACFSKL_11370 [Belliella marina]|uniref:GAF domain-containing protein n=1 Tax=Belliella marina TaxID=1644146 RepID=A0ABW4VNY7_9BACT